MSIILSINKLFSGKSDLKIKLFKNLKDSMGINVISGIKSNFLIHKHKKNYK